MNLFNRIFTIITLLLIIALAAVVLVAPHQALASLNLWLAYLDASIYGQVGRIAVSLLVMALSFMILFRQLKRAKPSKVMVGNVDGAIAELSVNSIAQRLNRDLLAMENVRAVQTTVTAHRNSVDVHFNVNSDSHIDVPTMAANVGRVARESLENRMGLKVGKLVVNINQEAGGVLPPSTTPTAPYAPAAPDALYMPDAPTAPDTEL